MNHFHAKTEWVDGAWRALVRYSHKADYWPVMSGETPAGFASRDKALIAAYQAQEKHLNGTIRGFGDKVSAARAEAERLFRPGRKPVVVEHMSQAAGKAGIGETGISTSGKSEAGVARPGTLCGFGNRGLAAGAERLFRPGKKPVVVERA